MSSESRGSQALEPGVLPRKPQRPWVQSILARAQSHYRVHPLLVTWGVLAVGMVVILLWAARDVDLLAHQRLFLVLATAGLAGLCAWIIGWED